MKLYHVTTWDKKYQKVLYPRIPAESLAAEDTQIERISFSSSIKGCIFGIGQIDKFHNGDKIRIYEIKVELEDKALYTPQKLYYEGLVNNALLSNEFWYLKSIQPYRYYEYEVNDIKTERFIVISAMEEEIIKKYLQKEQIYYGKTEDIITFINYKLDADRKEKIKELLTIEKDEDSETEALYYKIFKEKRTKTYDDYIHKYNEYRYISDCKLTMIGETKDLRR